ncbi:MAG TPA: M12 family metallopeptidase [Thermoanaerobaculia bacterium]
MRKQGMARILGVTLPALLLGSLAVSAAEVAFPHKRGEVRKVGYYVADRLVEVIEVEVIEGQAVFQGDIVFPLSADGNVRIGSFLDAIELEKSTGRTSAKLLWANRTVPFVLDESLTGTQRIQIQDALNHWRNNTRLTFVDRTFVDNSRQTDLVTFRKVDEGCSSAVGRIGRPQLVNLGTECSTGVIIHEIGHIVGLWHEHQRTDRDNSVIVKWENILSGRENNFQTYAALGQNGGNFGAALDFGSIMMYSSHAFSSNGQPTLTRLDGTTFAVQRTALSPADKNGVNCNMYPSRLTVALSCSGNFKGSLQVHCTADTGGGGLPLSYRWTYNGAAPSWSSDGQNAHAGYSSPGCQPGNLNRFSVTVTDACGQSRNRRVSVRCPATRPSQ